MSTHGAGLLEYGASMDDAVRWPWTAAGDLGGQGWVLETNAGQLYTIVILLWLCWVVPQDGVLLTACKLLAHCRSIDPR